MICSCAHRPRRVVRFRRGVIIGVAALGSGVILGVTIIALQGPALRITEQAEELYTTDRKPTAEGLKALPADYSRLKPDVPVLGPPLPGDLGRPIKQRPVAQPTFAIQKKPDQPDLLDLECSFGTSLP